MYLIARFRIKIIKKTAVLKGQRFFKVKDGLIPAPSFVCVWHTNG